MLGASCGGNLAERRPAARLVQVTIGALENTEAGFDWSGVIRFAATCPIVRSAPQQGAIILQQMVQQHVNIAANWAVLAERLF